MKNERTRAPWVAIARMVVGRTLFAPLIIMPTSIHIHSCSTSFISLKDNIQSFNFLQLQKEFECLPQFTIAHGGEKKDELIIFLNNHDSWQYCETRRIFYPSNFFKHAFAKFHGIVTDKVSMGEVELSARTFAHDANLLAVVFVHNNLMLNEFS